MTKNESELLAGIVYDIENADDKIDGLERLYQQVRKMIIKQHTI